MADVAGFEPTVPGLGGRCIIQTMLHARFGERVTFKKCEGARISVSFIKISELMKPPSTSAGCEQDGQVPPYALCGE